MAVKSKYDLIRICLKQNTGQTFLQVLNRHQMVLQAPDPAGRLIYTGPGRDIKSLLLFMC